MIEQLKIIPMEAKELKIYVDYAYLNYAIYKRDKKNILFYTAELLNDDIEQYGGHLTAIDFYIDLLPFYIELGYHEIVTKLFDILSTLINVDEIQPLLKLSKLKILFSKTFHDGSLQKYYQEYYALYLENEKFTRKIKVQGLNTRLKANEITIENVKSKKQIHDLKKMIHYDELTNVYNRRYLKLKYNEIFARRKKRIISIAIIDVDYFKEYNDYYGHLAGDAILKIIAVCLKDACRDQMLVCRYGGDEFLVLCWDNDAPYLHNYLLEVIENIRKLNIPHSTSKCAQQLTLSIGYGIQEMRDQSEILSFFEKVDKALYASKEKGRNQVNEID